MINYRKSYAAIAIVTLLISAFIAHEWDFYGNKGELTALIDVTLTSIALTIAILEIMMVRSIAESSKDAVEDALGRISEIFSVSDISKGVSLAYDIQKYLRNKDYIIAHIRMQDLKSIIIPFKNARRFETIDSSKELPHILTTLSIDINNIDSVISATKPKIIDITKINGNLEILASLLLEYENHIKSLKTAPNANS